MHNTLLKILDNWALERADRNAYIFLDSQGQEQESISFKDLRNKAIKIARALVARQLSGQRVVLMLTPSLNFIVTFLGCLYAGSIAVPIPPPKSRRQIARSIPIVQDANASLILTDQLFEIDMTVLCMSTEQLLENSDLNENELSYITQNNIAFLQYTSGSTSLPKGVMLTHFNLFHHQKVIQNAFRHDHSAIIVGWLPFYHDMGLIGNILQPLYLGTTSILMAPMTFMQQPIIWLRTISKYKATTSGGPNFAYQHCVSKIKDTELEGLDLSSWKLAFNGSERVRMETLNSFHERFCNFGFHLSSFFPCYGLAEATLFVAGRQIGHSIPFKTASGQITNVVSCGRSISNLEENVAIVDPSSKHLLKDEVCGEIWVQSPSVAIGYWGKEEETKKTFAAYTNDGCGPYLRTGDLGFIKDQELYVLERLKNLIVIRGKNYFPNDLETCVQNAHPCLLNSQGIVCSHISSEGESFIILQEVDRNLKNNDHRQADEIFQSIRRALVDEFEIAPEAIYFFRSNSLPRTTSGKLQHYVAYEQLQQKVLIPLFSWEKGVTEAISKDNFTEVLSQLLGISQSNISSRDTIVSLGIDSLVGMQIISWLYKNHEIELELNFLLNGATVGQVEDIIQNSSSTHSNKISTSLNEYPLSWNQESIWTYLRIHPQSLAYNILFAFQIKGFLDIHCFKGALNQLVQLHPLLRTKFENRSTGPIQIVQNQVDLLFYIKDFTSVPFNHIDMEINSCIYQESQIHFDLTQAPLFRTNLLKISDEKIVLIFHFHHIICDGWSIRLLMSQLETIYLQNVKLQQAQLYKSSAYYSDFVQWQKKMQASIDYQKTEHHWQKLLTSEEYNPLVVTPFHSVEGERGAGSMSVFLDSQNLKNFALKQKTTLSTVLMAAFHAVIHLYSDENMVYVGFPNANRSKAEFHDVVGFFVNTLVCKTTLSPETTFLELMEQIQKCAWSNSNEASYPLQHVLNLLKPTRFPHTSPLFQVMFVMQNAPVDLEKFANLDLELLKTPLVQSLYDLVLEAREKKNQIELIFEYQKEKVSSHFIKEFQKTFLKLIATAIEFPNLPVNQYCLIEEKEYSQSFEKISSHLDLSCETIVSLFESQAKQNSKKIAIYSDYSNFTYEQLSNTVDAIAISLIKKGIKPGDPVAICLEKEPLLIAALLGVLKAGGAYVPIDPAYPSSRMQAMIEDAKIDLLIVSDKLKSQFSFFKGEILSQFDCNEALIFPTAYDLRNPAYILYTSGSTGEPKGVVVEHASLLNFVNQALKFFEMTSADNVLQFSSIGWDTASEEIYPCLLVGGSLVMRGNGRIESFEDLLSRTEKNQITVWDLPTSYWHDLMDMVDRKKISLPKSLRLVIVGGEKVKRSKVDLWRKNISLQIKLLNTYGATEATSISAIFDLMKWDSSWSDVPIGHPVAGVQMYILNSSLQPVPPGVAGTLYIAGKGLAKEYLNLPKLTSQKFISFPKTGERIYNTGDTAYFSLTGEIIIKGRKDRQIKRRGYRVELEEIEAAISKLDFIETCLVDFDHYITAYLVNKQSTNPPLTTEIKTYLRSLLPDYLIPDFIVFLQSMPRLPNGKIDMVTLRAHKKVIDEAVPTINYNSTEQSIHAIWTSILKVEIDSKELSFFDVGGNSLLLLQLHEKIQETFDVQFNISILFSYFTIAAQARKIDEFKINHKKLSKIELLKLLESGKISPLQASELLKAAKGTN